MNRTYSHSFRPYGSTPVKSRMQKSAIGFGFRTLWKDRDTHQLSNNPKSSGITKKKTSDTINKNMHIFHSRQVSNQGEMKDFVKMMKKKS